MEEGVDILVFPDAFTMHKNGLTRLYISLHAVWQDKTRGDEQLNF